MKLKLRANPANGQMVMPAPLRKEWGNDYEMRPNAVAGVIYPEKTKLQDVIDSVEVIIHDLQNEAKREE